MDKTISTSCDNQDVCGMQSPMEPDHININDCEKSRTMVQESLSEQPLTSKDEDDEKPGDESIAPVDPDETGKIQSEVPEKKDGLKRKQADIDAMNIYNHHSEGPPTSKSPRTECDCHPSWNRQAQVRRGPKNCNQKVRAAPHRLKIKCPVPKCSFETWRRRDIDIHVSNSHACDYCGKNFIRRNAHRCKLQIGGGRNNDTVLNLGKFQVLETSQKGVIQTIRHENTQNNLIEIPKLFGYLNSDIVRILEYYVETLNSIRARFAVELVLKKESDEKEVKTFLHSSFMSLGHRNFIPEIIERGVNYIVDSLDLWSENGSGYSVKSILGFDIVIAKYSPFKGGSDKFDLPQALKYRHGIVNIKSPKNECFRWAFISSIHYNEVRGSFKQRRHLESYKIFEDKYDFSMLKFPVQPDKLDSFERKNRIGINVFGFSKKEPYPIRIVQNKFENVTNLLLLNKNVTSVDKNLKYEENDCHFVGIHSFSRFMGSSGSKTHSYCPYCLNRFLSEQVFSKHVIDCAGLGVQRIVMPSRKPCGSPDSLKFTNFEKNWIFPYYLVSDHECLSLPENKQISTNVKFSRKFEPFGYGIILFGPEETIYRDYFGLNSMDHFFKDVLELAEYALASIRQKEDETFVLDSWEQEWFDNQQNCEFCQTAFTQTNPKTKHHIHSEGRGSNHYAQLTAIICAACNLKVKPKSWIPCIQHNSEGFDSKLIVSALNSKHITSVDIWPINSQKFSGITINKVVRFIDSLGRLQSSLDNLVNIAKKKNGPQFFKQTRKVFNCLTDWQFSSVLQKQVLCYGYLQSFAQLYETELPAKEHFYDDLNECECSENDYNHALFVFKLFECKTILDYVRLYTKFDCYLLLDLFNAYRDSAIANWSLDPLHSLSSASYSFSCFMFKSKAEFEYIHDPELLTMLRRSTYGGLCFANIRHIEANIPKYPGYNDKLPKIQIVGFDVASLYGYIMMLPLPYKGFRKLQQFEVDQLFENNCQALRDHNFGKQAFFLEINAFCPKETHDFLSCLPPMCERYEIRTEILSPYQKEQMTNMNLNTTSTSRLALTLLPKTKYCLHSHLLQVYLQLGVVVTEITSAWIFTEEPIVRDYITDNLQRRARATDEIARATCKLQTNSLFGFFILDLARRIKVKAALNDIDAVRLISKPNFLSLTQVSDNVTLVNLKNLKVSYTFPYATGNAILNKSKAHMYRIWYDHLKTSIFKNNMIKLAYMDTDGLILAIYLNKDQEDCYDLIKDANHVFDFSNFPCDHKVYNTLNQAFPAGKLQSEFPGSEIQGVVCLAAKTYSVLLFDNTEKNKAKGIKKSCISRLRYENYKRRLYEGGCDRVTMNCIRSKNQQLYVMEVSKTGLSALSVKNYLLGKYGTHSLPFGHWRLEKMEEDSRELEKLLDQL